MPTLVATVHIVCPADTPTAVKSPATRPPRSVLRIVSAVSWPGVTITSADTPRNARSSPIERRGGDELAEAALHRGRGPAARLPVGLVGDELGEAILELEPWIRLDHCPHCLRA